MKNLNDLLTGYENARILHYTDTDSLPPSIAYEELPERDNVSGVLKANRHVDGKLMQLYSGQESHVGVIAATRMGKTTSYVIPTLLSLANRATKPSVILSDPKGELFRTTGGFFAAQGYDVISINFRDYLHSACWNFLTPIYRAYHAIGQDDDRIKEIHIKGGVGYLYRGEVCQSEQEAERVKAREHDLKQKEVSNQIDEIAELLVSVDDKNQPEWERDSREILKGFLWGMLEDSDKKENPITEDTFSISTVLSILATMHDSGSDRDTTYHDNGYFSDREVTSRAYQHVSKILLENAPRTRRCILATLDGKLAFAREAATNVITSCNSFDMADVIRKPTVIYIIYQDELKVHYQLISLFVQDAYRYLINHANHMPSGKLEVPFYFILDEFGNFPALRDFDTTISACGGRNIFFTLILQSYAQLDRVYGHETAVIIRDNLNVHVFMGSNNPDTLKAFSQECGMITRLSPLSALNGTKSEIEQFQLETIPAVPVSTLSHFERGECVVTEANSGYTLFSKLEPYYECPEFQNLPKMNEWDYVCPIDPFDPKYRYPIEKIAAKVCAKNRRPSLYDLI